MPSAPLVSERQCTVTAEMLNTYEQAKEQSSRGPRTFTRGQRVSYANVVSGEDINRDGHHTNRWGYQSDTRLYFWLGGTDHPNG